MVILKSHSVTVFADRTSTTCSVLFDGNKAVAAYFAAETHALLNYSSVKRITVTLARNLKVIAMC